MNLTPVESIRPVEDCIVVLPDSQERVEAGIIIPEAVRQRVRTGLVVSVGPGKFAENGKRIPHNIEPGDRVWFDEYAGAAINTDVGEHFILRAEEVHAREPLAA